MLPAMDRRLFLALGLLAAAPAAARAGESDKKKTGGESYIQIETLTAFTYKPGVRRGVMTVDCGLDIADSGLRDRAELLLPRLRAAYVQTVQIYAGGLPAGFPPNTDFLKRSLQRVTDQTLGRKGANVLLGAVLVN
jgi:hypothetical protein